MKFFPGDSDHIKREDEFFDWKSAFIDQDSNEKVSVLNDTIMITITNFIPNKIIICDDRDPPWTTHHLKKIKFLMILTGKRQPQIKFKRLQKV